MNQIQKDKYEIKMKKENEEKKKKNDKQTNKV